jgi:hypothetical protein
VPFAVSAAKAAAVEMEMSVVREPIASGAHEVCWEHEGRDPAHRRVGPDRGTVEPLDAEHRTQSRLVDALSVPNVPVVDAGRDRGQRALVDDGARSVSGDDLARAQLAGDH